MSISVAMRLVDTQARPSSLRFKPLPGCGAFSRIMAAAPLGTGPLPAAAAARSLLAQPGDFAIRTRDVAVRRLCAGRARPQRQAEVSAQALFSRDLRA